MRPRERARCRGMFAGIYGSEARRFGRVPEGAVGMVSGVAGLLLQLAGLALPEGGTSTILALAIGFFVADFVFLTQISREGA